MKKHLLVPLLALSMTLAAAAWVGAQDRHDQGGTSVSLQINFGTAPHWESVRGTSVRVIRQGDRTDYDMFRYGRYYYAYNHDNDQWYRGRNWRGRFIWIHERSLPAELRRVPRQHWRHYPSSWEDRRGGTSGASYATLQVTFGTRPHWIGVQGTRVEVIPEYERPAYDVFRYGGTYYAYQDNRWYSSNRETGNFTRIDDRSVPSEFTRVPREHWRHYPSGWQDQGQKGTPPGLEKKGGNPPGQEKKRGR